MSFVITTVSACVMVVVTVWFAMRDTARAEAVMEAEYDRSEALLANMLPASIAERLKEPDRDVIADKYEEASVLFADIVGFTERASSTAPADLVRFLDRLYSAFDALVDKHGLEKIKVSGDSYMVVSGVPRPRPDHVQALADFALDMAAVAAGTEDPHGRSVPLRVGLATGPVVAGVVGSRRFFYDVWGDAVNVASRMESTDSVGRIQVPDEVYERLKDDFVLQERGRIERQRQGHHAHLVSDRPQGRQRPNRRPAGRGTAHRPRLTAHGQRPVSHCAHGSKPRAAPCSRHVAASVEIHAGVGHFVADRSASWCWPGREYRCWSPPSPSASIC